ncbi:unnamed protein product [Calypogeia fissa]
MDNQMVPPRTSVVAGGNVKPARHGKSSAALVAVGESGEEGGGPGAGAASAMGMLKRKRTTPPESPAPSKKRASEEAELPKPSSSEQRVEGTPTKKIESGKSLSPSGDARASSKQLSGQSDELGPEESARVKFQKDVDELQNRVPAVMENLSYGQESPFRAPPGTSGPAVALTKDCEAQPSAKPHLVPSHAGWFQWEKIHQLERAALPEYFTAKDTKKTPEIYIEQRTCIMKKYRENPQKLLKFEDVRELLTGDVSGAVRLLGFLDHWGLINYQAITDFSPFLSRGASGRIEEANGVLSASPLVKPALANLFNFEAPALAPAHKPPAISPSPASNLPISSLAEAAVQESLAAPAVEYHCNSCQADCSKRRYHCQKQADFDLCPDCYNDGKFGYGMSGTDFLRMDALTETADVNGGGWSDQETLLLLEALELYGDNWTEIAEHVATKSKAQCILHFIRLPIEDPFLEDMEASSTVLTVRPPGPVVSDNQSTSHKDKSAQTRTAQSEHPSSSESIEAVPSSLEQDASAPTETGQKDRPGKNRTQETELSSPKKEGNEEADASKVVSDVKDSSGVHPLLAASERAGCAAPDGLIAFADAGNPVMTQVAFLAAMVGPRVAASAAQAALKSLAEDDPVGFLSVKNSFALDGSDASDTKLASGCSERSSGQQSTEMSLVSSTGGPTVASDSKSTPKGAEEAIKKNADEKVAAGTLEKVAVAVPFAGQEDQTTQRSEGTAPTNSLCAEQDVPSIAKVRTAAANALASAAVKAKLLADQEEREIQRLVAGVIDNQLKKLELKLKQFGDLESMLGKECEQAEKARAKVYAERARIMASRLGSSSSVSQLQSTVATAASYSKTSTHPVNLVGQPRPAVFTFGPTGHSAPAAGYLTTTGQESSFSMAASASVQQGVTQRLSRAVPGTSLAFGAKE